ncbi:MAG: AraC family transcriptional regulator [Alphaproteobacteria bacterium]|nr:AraC family transcriptional regulator [Alphaproteobacteria bacterium]
MKERDSLEPRGAVLDPAAAIHPSRHAPPEALTPWVRHVWIVRWSLGSHCHVQHTLTVPAVNAVVEADTATVSGVWTRRFERALTGEGAVFGVLFHATGFAPVWGGSMHALTDRELPWEDLLGEVAHLRQGLFAAPDDAAAADVLFERLSDRLRGLPAPDPEVSAWARTAEADPTLGKAEALAEVAGVSLRTLQRGFRRHVGWGPKQVLRRHRLLEASHRLAHGESVDLAELALRLGYADQAHLARDFADAVGRPPGRYAAAQRGSVRREEGSRAGRGRPRRHAGSGS